MPVKWDDRKLRMEVDWKIRSSMEKAVLMVEGDAKRFVAVDTGRLRTSITHEIEQTGHEIIGRVGTNVFYGIFQEYGTSDMSAHPFLRPSLKRNITRIRQLFKGR